MNSEANLVRSARVKIHKNELLHTKFDFFFKQKIHCTIAAQLTEIRKASEYIEDLPANKWLNSRLDNVNCLPLMYVLFNLGLARIFCDNSDGTITTIQPQAFLAASGT